jgi:hypothetical protein
VVVFLVVVSIDNGFPSSVLMVVIFELTFRYLNFLVPNQLDRLVACGVLEAVNVSSFEVGQVSLQPVIG